MSADGSPEVDAEGDVPLAASHVPAVAWSMIGGGVLLVAAGATTVTLGGGLRRG